MNDNMPADDQKLILKGLTPELEQKIRLELEGDGCHEISRAQIDAEYIAPGSPEGIYTSNDLCKLQNTSGPKGSYVNRLRSIDELLERGARLPERHSPRRRLLAAQ